MYQLAPGVKLRDRIGDPGGTPARRPPLLLGAWGPRGAALAGQIADEIKVGGSANPAVVPLIRDRVRVGCQSVRRSLDQIRQHGARCAGDAEVRVQPGDGTLNLVTQILVAGIEMAAGNQRPPQLIGRRTTPDLDHGAPIAVEHHGLADQPGVGDAFPSQFRPGPAAPQGHDHAGRRGTGQARDDQVARFASPGCCSQQVTQAGEEVDVTADGIAFQLLDGRQAAPHAEELQALHAEVRADLPYGGPDDAALFAGRFLVQRRQPGFVLAEARHGGYLVGYGSGMPLRPATSWWRDLTTPLPDEVTAEHPGRTFALTDLLVRASWRRQGIGQGLHDLILASRAEERATLTVLPAATPAQNAFRTWGWRKVARTRGAGPGSQVSDVLVAALPYPQIS